MWSSWSCGVSLLPGDVGVRVVGPAVGVPPGVVVGGDGVDKLGVVHG